MSLKRLALSAVGLLIVTGGTIIAIIRNLVGNEPTELFVSLVNILSMVALVFLMLIVAIEIFASCKLEGSTIHTVLLAAALFFYYLCSTDIMGTFASIGLHFHPQIADIFSLIFFICIVASVVNFFNYLYKLHLPKWGLMLAIVLFVICLLFYSMLQEYKLQYIPFFVFALCSISFMEHIKLRIFRENKDDFTYYMTSAILSSAYGAQLVYVLDKCNLITVSTTGYSLIYMSVIILLFMTIYLYYIIRTARTALSASEYKLQVNTLKSEILREQIKPHFVFNALTTIKALYHDDVGKGDKAMNMFSRHLRSNVEAAGTDLIPFERELDNIQNYIELENTRYNKPYNVIFNIDCTDFCVPILSLQPFVENAIKYSKINAKEDGYIEISTSCESEEIKLEIADNGEGFDTTQIKSTSCGIRNSRERFRLLMNAHIDIESAPGEGTRVTIHIKKPAECADGAADGEEKN